MMAAYLRPIGDNNNHDDDDVDLAVWECVNLCVRVRVRLCVNLLSYSCNSSTAVKSTALCSGSLIFNSSKSSSSRSLKVSRSS